MRLKRTFDRTRGLLLKKGVTSTAAAPARALGIQASLAIPGGLAASISAAALDGGASASGVTTSL